jgi:hypothetical protein
MAVARTDDVALSIAEVVWVQRMDGKNHIRHAQFDGQQWEQTSASLYSSNFPLTNPTIGTKTNGERLLIWVERVKNKTVLMQMNGRYPYTNRQPPSDNRHNNRIWSVASVLSNVRLENFSPCTVVDAMQKFWVVWSSSSATQSDIFMIRETEDGWSSPHQVNPDNLTPDMRPMVNTDIAGNIYVVWTAYDQVAKGFTENSAVYSLQGNRLDPKLLDYADSLKVHKAEEHSLAGIIDPRFLPEQSRILIHFPHNTLIQTSSH